MKTSNILFGIAILAGAALGVKYISNLLKAFRFKVVGYGIPTFQNWILKLPVTVRFTNPTAITINADNVIVDVYMKNSAGNYIHIGHVDEQGLSLAPGDTDQTMVPVLNLQAVTGAVINSWADLIGGRTASIRTDVTVTYKGVTLPTQEYEDTVKL